MAPFLRRAARSFPAVVLTGPRRAGKTFLLRNAFPRASYHLLEDPDAIARIRADPRGWLDDIETPAILDFYENVGKRPVKSPKLYWVEIVKNQIHVDRRREIYHSRDQQGLEVSPAPRPAGRTMRSHSRSSRTCERRASKPTWARASRDHRARPSRS